MIDTFSIMLSHGLLLLAFWRLLTRDELDEEKAADRAAPQPDEAARQPRKDTIFPHA